MHLQKEEELIVRSFRVSSCVVSAPWGAGMSFQQRAQKHTIFQVAENAVGVASGKS
jgi:hypothetical protein